MFVLAHLSDPHLGPLPGARLAELASKRLIGYVNWHRNRVSSHRSEVLREMVGAIRAARPDHIAVTGDLVNIGLPAEFVRARQWLEALGSPETVSLVPGNHDAYVRGAIDRARQQWGPFQVGDDFLPVFPYVRRRGAVAVIGLSTARATPPFLATGALGRRQLAAFEDRLRELAKEKLFRVVLIHHPVVAGAAPWHKRLLDARSFRRVIARAGAELILHGHNHMRSIAAIAGPAGPVPVVGVPAASSPQKESGHPAAAFNLYRIDGKAGSFSCTMTEIGLTEPGHPMHLISEHRLIG